MVIGIELDSDCRINDVTEVDVTMDETKKKMRVELIDTMGCVEEMCCYLVCAVYYVSN